MFFLSEDMCELGLSASYIMYTFNFSVFHLEGFSIALVIHVLQFENLQSGLDRL